jgi:proteasome lid subunit RPN8/RPN11
MLDHVRACLPEEACGLLAGREGRVEHTWPIENAAHSPVQFRMEPRAQVQSLLAIETRGWDLLAIYHSHPSGPTGPSGSDQAEWAYPEALALIWCCEGGSWGAQAFDLSGAAPTRVDIELIPES